MPIVFRALKQILRNQLAIMETLYNIAHVMSRTQEPGDSDSMLHDAASMVAQYVPSDMRIKEL